ncbi:MAG: class I SAM-dependent methyltransferase, partial [Candidatus Acidiferrales bacterium]
MTNGFVFDQSHYDALNDAREPVIRQLLESLRQARELRTAVDLGCGVGYYSAFLRDLGFRVLALDGRPENIAEARRRVSGIEFGVVDAEDAAVRSFGRFDLVLCLGLYYHLENPFVAFRNLLAMTGTVAILEGMCVPGVEPVLAVRDEGPTEDQGLRHVALYPTENGLIKLLYRAGFPKVYRFRTMPNHPNYMNSPLSRQKRTILVASFEPLETVQLELATEPATIADPWAVRWSARAVVYRARNFATHISNFAAKPWPEKQRVLQRRWSRMFP